MQIWTWKGWLYAGRAAALCGAVLAALAAVAPLGAAASRPASPAHPRPATAVTETAKVTLPETSIAGPGFHITDLAWTGTDPAHHLNVRIGTGGLDFPTKITLPETSLFAPAITFIPGEVPLTFVVAWTGTDPNHSLNVEIFPSGSTTAARKVILPETSIAAPALVFGLINGGGNLLLAWTGTDPNHSLNVLPISGNLARGQKTVLSQFGSDAGPSLLGNVDADNFVLGWSVRGTQQLNLAESTDGAHFTSALGAGLPETSAAAPQFIQPDGSASGCIAWTGTDPANHLNVQCTAQFPQFPNPAQTKTELSETALDAPGFSGLTAGTLGTATGEIAWTGTDPAHHLNVAQLQGL